MHVKKSTKIMERDNWECWICHNKDCALEIHHKTPVVNGGNNDNLNLVSLCRSCHRAIHRDDIEKCINNAIDVCLNGTERRKESV